ncbi:TrmH family RNA methyltransferase [Brachybacterium hainanense]|uniref:TrmH family RNA methyltransferase n=1 Tax=Brachybacterium hainanense TaxID=1541174 RepID=A0ABV6R7X1_9MICO
MSFPERPDDQTITSPRSDRVRRIASLSGRSARRRHGLLRVEGPQAVRSLLQHRPDALGELFLTQEAAAAHPELAALAAQAGHRPRRIEPEALRAMVREQDAEGALQNPQGVVATARTAALDLPLAAALAGLPAGPSSILVLHELRDPGNAGTLIRTADAAGADLVILTAGSVDVHAPKVVRASVGSLFHLGVVTGADPATLYRDLAAAGVSIAATSGYAASDLFGTALPPRIAWVMGNEAHGLPDAVLEIADLAVRIPLAGNAESLNVATAATVCLFESLRRRGDP